MWFLNVTWPAAIEVESDHRNLKMVRRFLLETSSELRIARNSKPKGGGSDAPNFIIPASTVSSKAGVLKVGPFNPDSDPSDPTTRPRVEFHCANPKGTSIGQAKVQPDAHGWKINFSPDNLDFQKARERFQSQSQSQPALQTEDFLIDPAAVVVDTRLEQGEKLELQDGDIIVLSPSMIVVLEWVPIAICSKDKEEKRTISRETLTRSGIYFTFSPKSTPKGYNYYSASNIHAALGPIQAAVNRSKFVKPKFSKELLKHVEEVLETDSEIIRDEKGVGKDMNYMNFRIPEIKADLSHLDLSEVTVSMDSELKEHLLMEKDRRDLFRGVTFYFLYVDGIDDKSLEVAKGFVGIVQELGGAVKSEFGGKSKFSGVSRAKQILEPIQKEAFENFQRERKKSKVLIGSELDSFIVVPIVSANQDARDENAIDVLRYVVIAASELNSHDIASGQPLATIVKAIATCDLKLITTSSFPDVEGGDRGVEIPPQAASTSKAPTLSSGAEGGPTSTSKNLTAQDEIMEEIPPTNPQPTRTVPPSAAPLRRRTRTNRVDNGLDPSGSGANSGQMSTKADEAPVAPVRTGPLKRRAKNGQDFSALLFGNAEEQINPHDSNSNSNLKTPSQPQSMAQRLLKEEEERERLEALGESAESELKETEASAGKSKRLKSTHQGEVSKRSELETVGEDVEMDSEDNPKTGKSKSDEKNRKKRRAEDDYEDEDQDEEREEEVTREGQPGKENTSTQTSRKRRENEVNNPNDASKTGLTIQATQNKGNEDGKNLDQDEGFLQALKSRAKTSRSVVDDFDKDFNRMKISRKRINEVNKEEIDEEYEAWKKLSTEDLEAFKTQNGNFIKVDKVPLVKNHRDEGVRRDGSRYQDGVLKGEWKEEWNGRIDHKKFKKVERVRREPLKMTLTEPHDYGLGPGYGSRPKPRPKGNVSRDEMEQDDLQEEEEEVEGAEGEGEENTPTDQDHLSIAPTARSGRNNKTQGMPKSTSNSTQGKRKGTLRLDWSEESGSEDDLDESLGSTIGGKKGQSKGKNLTAAQKKKQAAAEAKQSKASKSKGKGKGKGRKRGALDSDDEEEEEEDELVTDSDQEDAGPKFDLDLDLSDENDDFSISESAAKKPRKAPAVSSKSKSKSNLDSKSTLGLKNAKSTAKSTSTSAHAPASASTPSTLKDSLDSDSQPIASTSRSRAGAGVGKIKSGTKRPIESIVIDDDSEDASDGADFAGFGGNRKRRRR